MRITSTTTSNLVNTPIAPITQSSLVAPPVGAFGTNQGTLGVQVNSRDGTGMEDVSVTITGPAPSRTRRTPRAARSSPTCRSAAYTAKLDTTGWVDKGGNRPQRRRTVSQRHRQRQEPRLRPGRQRRRHLRHRDPRRRHGARHGHAAVGRQRRGAHRPVRPVRRRCASGTRRAARVGTISATGLFPSPTATASTAAAARAPTRRRTTPTTSRPSARTRSSPSIPPPRRRRPRSGSRRSTCACSTTAPPLRVDLPGLHAHPRHLDEPNCTEKFSFAAPSTTPTAGCSSRRCRSAPTRCAPSRARRPRPTSLRKKEITGVNNFYYHGMKPPDVVSPVDRPQQPAPEAPGRAREPPAARVGRHARRS